MWFTNEAGPYDPVADHPELDREAVAVGRKKEAVLRVYGNPKRESFKEGKEFWVYDHDVAWRGLLLVFVVPVPLMIPAGMNEVIFTFENDQLLYMEKEHAKPNGFFCQTVINTASPCINFNRYDVRAKSNPTDITDTTKSR
jgi:hypothetical protein